MPDEAAPPQPPMDAIVELKEKIAKIKQEVDDALQIASKQAEGSGLRSPTLIISLLALLFSFGTTAVSYYRTRQQDIHDSRTELRGLIERLSQLPRENLENSKKYAGEPGILNDLSGFMNAENSVIVQQAADIIERIPNHVAAAEISSVAYALSNSALVDRSLRLTKLGLDVASNLNDEIGLRRFYASSLFQVGETEKGREQYRTALSIFAKYTPMNSYYVEMTNFLTEKMWALSELYARQCSYVDAHIAEAQHHLAALAPGPNTDQYKGQFAAMQQTVKSCIP